MPAKIRTRPAASPATQPPKPASLGSRMLGLSEELNALQTAIVQDMAVAPHLEHNPHVVAFLSDLGGLCVTLGVVADRVDQVRGVCEFSAGLSRKDEVQKTLPNADPEGSPGASELPSDRDRPTPGGSAGPVLISGDGDVVP